MKYFYATFFAAGAFLLLSYAAWCFQQGIFYIKGGAFRRSTDAPAFWLCMSLFCLPPIGLLIAAVGLVFGVFPIP
jgi:hypothetical protein